MPQCDFVSDPKRGIYRCIHPAGHKQMHMSYTSNNLTMYWVNDMWMAHDDQGVLQPVIFVPRMCHGCLVDGLDHSCGYTGF